MMNDWNLILTMTSIIVTVIGIVISIQHERKSRLPRLVLTHSFDGL